MRSCLFFLPVVLCTVFAATLQARIIHVPGDSATIQGGIDGAVDGDTVMVAPGTYYEHELDFLGKAITVTGTDPEDSAVVAATVVDADWGGGVVVFQSGEDSSSVLAGLTITGGYAKHGGGVLCTASSPKIISSIIARNHAGGGWGEGGGGMYNENSSPVVINCMFSGNVAGRFAGGGMIIDSSSPPVSRCLFKGNFASTNGGGMYNDPGSSPKVTNCTFKGNSATIQGGGMYNSGLNKPKVTKCTFSENRATYGAGMCNQRCSDPTITNSILRRDIGAEVHNDPNSVPVVTYSNVQGGYAAKGNMDTDPLFISFHGFDCLLMVGSPCIDTGDPSIEDGVSDWHPRWPEWYTNGSRSDMGAYGGPGNVDWLR